MLGIKTLLVRFFTLFFLSLAFTLLLSTIILYELPDHAEGIKNMFMKSGKQIVEQVSAEETPINETNFEDMKLICDYVEQGGNLADIDEELAENSEYIDEICTKINSGEITNSDELVDEGIDLFMGEKMSEMDIGLDEQVIKLQKLIPFTFLGFLFFYILAGGVLFIDRMKFGNWVRRFSKYSFLGLASFTLWLLILFIFANFIAGAVTQNLLSGMETEEISFSSVAGDIVLRSVEWFRSIVDFPLMVYFVLSIIGLFGWFTGFGIPNKSYR